MLPIISILLLAKLGFYSVHGDGSNIVGYVAHNDVSQHLSIDLDLQNMQRALNSFNFTEAYRWYSLGGSSHKTNGGIRTVRGFSTNAYTNLADEKWYKRFAKYWSDKAYANTFTSSACLGTSDFVESTSPIISDDTRKQCCIKGAQYQNVWLYVIHEMEEAVADCQNGIIGTHWDEAVAFYTGSIPTEDNSQIGYLLYGLAEKRCKEFGTCISTDDAYSSEVNQKVFDLFEQGRDYQYDTTSSEACSNMEATKEALVVQLIIPLIQGTLKYIYFADMVETESTRSELWAFASALLPIIDSQSESASKTLKDNALITNTDIVPDGYSEVKKQLESVYAGLGVSCAQVGGLQSSTSSTGYYSGMEPCIDNDSANNNDDKSENEDNDNAFKKWGMALMISLIVTFAFFIIILIYYYRKRLFQDNIGHIVLKSSDKNDMEALKNSDFSVMHNKI